MAAIHELRTVPDLPIPIRSDIDSTPLLKFPDKFIHLEQRSLENAVWDKEQNDRTQHYFENLPQYTRIREELHKLTSTKTLEDISWEGKLLFYIEQDPDKSQPILYVQDRSTLLDRIRHPLKKGMGKEPRALVDPNSMEGNVAMNWHYLSDDSEYVAYGISEKDTEETTLHIKSVTDGVELMDQIPNTRGCSLSWFPDNTGFYYTRFIEDEDSGKKIFHRNVYSHILGRDWQEDEMIFQASNPHEWTMVEVYDESEVLGKDAWYVLVTTADDKNNFKLYLGHGGKDKPDSPLEPLFCEKQAVGLGVIVHDDLYLLTDVDAPLGKIVTIDLKETHQVNASTWNTMIDEDHDDGRVLNGFGIAGDKLVLMYLRDAQSEIDIYDLGKGGSLEGIHLELPEKVGITDIKMDRNRAHIVYEAQSFDIPTGIVEVDIGRNFFKNDLTVKRERRLWGTQLPFEYQEFLDEIETRQVFYTAEDGTRIPMFLAMRKDTPIDGSKKVILEGYGGFGIPNWPRYRHSTMWWLKQGNIYAVANIPGGGEYGESWHRAGAGENKAKSIEYFTDAAQYLIENNYTVPSRLGIRGGSNGGMLVGAAVVQRPDLFGAVVAQVGLYDMVRFAELDDLGQYWPGEYGDPTNDEDFERLLAYSPYHSITQGTEYPAMLLLAGENDKRVNFVHTRKFAAALQEANGSDKPIFMSIDPDSGHGWGSSHQSTVEQAVAVLAFFDDQLK